MVIDIVTAWGLFLPAAWVAGVVLAGGLIGVWYALLAWFVLYAAGMTAWWLRGSWRGIRL